MTRYELATLSISLGTAPKAAEAIAAFTSDAAARQAARVLGLGRRRAEQDGGAARVCR